MCVRKVKYFVDLTGAVYTVFKVLFIERTVFGVFYFFSVLFFVFIANWLSAKEEKDKKLN